MFAIQRACGSNLLRRPEAHFQIGTPVDQASITTTIAEQIALLVITVFRSTLVASSQSRRNEMFAGKFEDD